MQERSCQECAFYSAELDFCAVNPGYCAAPFGECLDFEELPGAAERARRKHAILLMQYHARQMNFWLRVMRQAKRRGLKSTALKAEEFLRHEDMCFDALDFLLFPEKEV